ncbi:alpha/beta hydrolase [Nocardioides silvaticus]|uniref:alpha/beta hydrolase n=1 Tax=Nocardioides silvaticus TaxID=2201891 RepID=UPI001FE3AB34|nr:alpha/beta hydrolase [Nocardioides silvaticus]
MSARGVVESVLLRALLAPSPARRLVAGRPVTVDGQTLAPDLQAMLRLQSIARPRNEEVPIEKLRAGMRTETALVGGKQAIGSTRDLTVAGRPARHYLPSSPVSDEPGPLLVFLHGGGFIEGDLDTHDAPCRVLAERSGVPVLALTYRRGPEHPFPAAHDDADEGFRWVVDHADELGADPARIAVGGDSAGANLAASVALAAARDGVPLAWQLLIYPVTRVGIVTPSRERFAEGFYLSAEFIDRADASYTPRQEDRDDPRISILEAEIPPGLAPAYVVTAGFDPLRDEGEAYARRMADAGVAVELERRTDQIHGFFNIVGVGHTPRAGVDKMADRLRAALA